MNNVQRFSTAIGAWWAARQPRERLLMILAGSICSAALLVQLLWSAQQSVVRLKPAVAKLERSALLVRTLTNEIEQGAVPISRSTDINLQTATGLPPLTGLKITTLGKGRYRIEGATQFNDWLLWLANLHHSSSITLVTATVKTIQPGEVRVEAELERIL